MNDICFSKLARLLTGYSMRLQAGDTVLIDVMDTPDEMTIELIRAARELGAIPLLDIRHSKLVREMQMGTTPEHAKLMCEIELARMQQVQAYVAIRGTGNSCETSDVPSDNQTLYAKTLRPVLDHRVNKTRWVVLRWPTPSMAQAASMSTEAFEKLYFDVCTLDYKKMSEAMTGKRCGDDNHMSKPIICDIGEWETITSFSNEYGYIRSTVEDWLYGKHAMPIKWYNLHLRFKNEEYQIRCQDKSWRNTVYYDGQIFQSQAEFARYIGKSPAIVCRWIKNGNIPKEYLEKGFSINKPVNN